MRNAAYFLSAFLFVIVVGLLTGCALPDRQPQPYEKRVAIAHPLDSDFEQDWAAKKRENALWWNCTRLNRVDEC
jgi:hypothetical protein